jgi:hypothetical protein
MTAKTVDEYIAGLDGWRAEAVAALRSIVRAAAPKAAESVKWAQPVYDDNGPAVWIKAHRAHVNIGFWRGAELDDPQGLLEGDGDRMRHIKIARLADVKKGPLTALVKQAVRLNREKGNPTRGR